MSSSSEASFEMAGLAGAGGLLSSFMRDDPYLFHVRAKPPRSHLASLRGDLQRAQHRTDNRKADGRLGMSGSHGIAKGVAHKIRSAKHAPREADWNHSA